MQNSNTAISSIKKKNVSLDFKARALIYQTNFDLEYGQRDYSAKKIDANLGLAVGFTYYLGGTKRNAWHTTGQTIYKTDYRERRIEIVKVPEGMNPVNYSTLTFYIFYPNNYSGRNDAPLVPTSPVNRHRLSGRRYLHAEEVCRQCCGQRSSQSQCQHKRSGICRPSHRTC